MATSTRRIWNYIETLYRLSLRNWTENRIFVWGHIINYGWFNEGNRHFNNWVVLTYPFHNKDQYFIRAYISKLQKLLYLSIHILFSPFLIKSTRINLLWNVAKIKNLHLWKSSISRIIYGKFQIIYFTSKNTAWPLYFLTFMTKKTSLRNVCIKLSMYYLNFTHMRL